VSFVPITIQSHSAHDDYWSTQHGHSQFPHVDIFSQHVEDFANVDGELADGHAVARGATSLAVKAVRSVVFLGALAAAGCDTTIGPDGAGMAGTGDGAAAGGSGASGAAGTSGSAGTAGFGATAGTTGTGGSAGSTNTPCVGTPVTTPKRLVRLTENQLVNSYAALFTPSLAQTIAAEQAIPAATFRSFPPLATGGVLIGDSQFGLADRMAQAAMSHVAANLATVTACGAVPTDAACARDYLLSFAEKAFRRPLSEVERAAVTTELVNEMTSPAPGNGGAVAEAIQYGVYGILTSPGFLYRTEFGDDQRAMGPLDQYEIASVLSYFVTDAPPDQALLDRAQANQLSDRDVVRAEIERLLATPQARANLEAAMVAYFQLTLVPTVVVDPATVPNIQLTAGIQAQMFHEGELYMKNTLWNGPIYGLLTSPKTWVTPTIAQQIYGLAAPIQVDADGFGMITLGADRAGLLTLSPFLLAKTRPDAPSVVGRGLAINAALLCQDNPVFPDPVPPEIEEGIAASAGMSQREAADYRAERGLCAGCHAQFDGFGLVLEPYDSIGRFRTADLQGRPIDANTTTTVLPDVVGGSTVTSAVEMAEAVIASGALDRCMAMNLMNFALSDVSQGGAGAPYPEPPPSSCAVRDVYDRFNDPARSDKSFSALIREIAASDTLVLRSGGL
jgi:hypothetical protein